MKRVVICLMWLGEDWRVTRYQKWLKFMLSIKNELRFDKIILIDNASDLNLLKKFSVEFNANIINAETKEVIAYADHESIIDIYRYENHLTRTGIHEYPYCWRGLEFAQNFIKQNETLEKIYFIDSDFYVLTKNLTKYMRELNTGSTSFRCKKYGFAEAALFVLCRDWFKKYCEIPIPSYTHYNGQNMEDILPFSKVETKFNGDRYGEARLKQTEEMDYYGQWDTNCQDMIFNLKGE